MNDSIKIIFMIALIMALLVPITVHGITMTFNLEYEFSGATSPFGPPPWGTAIFDDSFGGPDTVRLTMSASGLVGTEFVDKWLFNFDPSLDNKLLTINPFDDTALLPDGIDGIYTNDQSISSDDPIFRGAGSGYYDILFDFASQGNFSSKFTSGETVIFDITYTGGPISASSFDYYSVNSSGKGTQKTAAHIQGIGPTGVESGWVTIPEPSALLLIGSLLIVIGVIKRKF